MDDIDWNSAMDYAIDVLKKEREDLKKRECGRLDGECCVNTVDNLIEHFQSQKIKGYEEEVEYTDIMQHEDLIYQKGFRNGLNTLVIIRDDSEVELDHSQLSIIPELIKRYKIDSVKRG